MSEHCILNGNAHLIVCFGGMASNFGGLIPFEFLNHLSKFYKYKCDMYFFVDQDQCWYHKGIKGITKNVEETKEYIDGIIDRGRYDRVIMMGTSAGGYAAILFGSICSGVTNVISFIPQTKLTDACDERYSDIKKFVVKNSRTRYILYGNTSICNRSNSHHILQCDRLQDIDHVMVIRREAWTMRQLRDEGVIRTMIDRIID